MATDLTRTPQNRQPSDSDALYCPMIRFRHAVDLSTVNQDLTATSGVWPEGFARRLYVGGSGTVVLQDLAGTAWTYANVAAGSYLDGPMTVIVKAGTTATNLIAEQ